MKSLFQMKKDKHAKTKPKQARRLLTPEEMLDEFYKKYGVRLCFDETEIDLTAPPLGNGLFIAKDISKMTFNQCTKLTMSIPMKQIKDLMPKMPELTYLGLIFCGLGRFFLRWHAFQNLETFDLTGNDISKVTSVVCVRNLPKLKTLILSENPIADNEEEKEKLAKELPNINIIYDK